MANSDCLSCQILVGTIQPPGGVIAENAYWLVDHTLPPILIPGSLTIKLKRHCEQLADLTPQEAATLGPLIQSVCQGLQQVTGAEKVHVASYGEGVRHIHFLVTPRTADLPASNIRLTYWLLWRRFLFRLGLKGVARAEQQAIGIAQQIRQSLKN